MDLPERETQGHQPLFLEDVLRKRFLQGGEDKVQGRCDEFEHQLPGDSACLELFGGSVHARQDTGLRLVGGVEFRMDHVDPSVEGLRLSEKEEGVPRNEPGMHVLDALEEHDFHFAGIVADEDGEPVDQVVLDLVGGQFRPVFREQAGFQDRADDLDVGLVRMDVGYLLDGTAVDVSEGVQAHEVSHRRHLEFAPQERSPPRTHARKVLDVHIQGLAHNAKIINLS